METSRIAVQMYEIQTPSETEAVIGLGVDRIGSVILSEKDWKVPAVREAILVSREAGIKHSLIPLFNTPVTLFQLLEYYLPDIVHFCDSLPLDASLMRFCEALAELQISLKSRFPEIEIMRTIPVRASGGDQRVPTFAAAECLEATSDYFLADTSLDSEPVHGFVGITGRTCDWTVAQELTEKTHRPVILAGGLSPANVYEAIMATRPFGVDSCTKTNAVDTGGWPIRFQKDLNAVRRFVDAVRLAERDLSKTQDAPESLLERKRP